MFEKKIKKNIHSWFSECSWRFSQSILRLTLEKYWILKLHVMFEEIDYHEKLFKKKGMEVLHLCLLLHYHQYQTEETVVWITNRKRSSSFSNRNHRSWSITSDQWDVLPCVLRPLHHYARSHPFHSSIWSFNRSFRLRKRWIWTSERKSWKRR